MQLVTTRKASSLTGLSTDQLREWTSRRALIVADIRPSGHGSPAKYAWQTVLLLRLAATLRDTFRVELQTHADLFADLRQALASTSFLFLWGKSLVIYGPHEWAFMQDGEPLRTSRDFILLRLDNHLEVLSSGFALAPPASPGQLELFPARPLARSAISSAAIADQTAASPDAISANPRRRRR